MNKQTARLLEQHFETAFDTPDGIKKLRELILTLAMRGRLVPQDPNDQPASELLKEIAAEKARLIKEGKLKPQKPLPPIDPKEIPYEIPASWQWTQLGEIGFWKAGSTPSRNESIFYGGNIAWVKSGEVKQGRVKFTEETITEEAMKCSSLTLNPPGSVLFAMYGANIGEVGILEIEAATNQAVCACQPFEGIFNLFLMNFLLANKAQYVSQGAGAAQPNFSKDKIIRSIFCVPPLNEQKRIVARVEQLMARCDELEKLRAARDEKRLETHAAALNALFGAADSGDFSTAWKFISRNFDELYTVKENVAELRKAILQLAVMGKLVPQNPNDQPASELLKEIAAEKARLIKEGKLKPQKPLPTIKPEESPFKIPIGWEWERLGILSCLITKGSSPNWQGVNYTDASNGILFITSENVDSFKLKWPNKKYVERKFNDIEPRSILKHSDILMNLVGASIGRVAYFNLDEIANINQAVCLIRIVGINKLLLLNYLLLFFNSQTCISYMFDKQVDNARANLSMSNVSQFLIPIPPLAEQKKIVARVEQLMALCDGLEQSIAATGESRSALLHALMSKV